MILELKITKKHIFLKRLSLVQFIKKKKKKKKKKKMGRWGSGLWALSSPAQKHEVFRNSPRQKTWDLQELPKPNTGGWGGGWGGVVVSWRNKKNIHNF